MKNNWQTNKPKDYVEPIEIPKDRLLKATDVASILGVSRAMAYRLMQSKIPTVNIGKARRVRPIDLMDFISENQFPGD